MTATDNAPALTPTLTIVMAQLTQAVGDLAANAAAMLAVRARHPDADLILYPELQLIGYPPEDLVLKPALADRAALALAELTAATADGGPAMLVGSIERDATGLYNVVALLDGGQVVAVRRKHELPNYGTFDEKRVFVPGPLPDVVEWRGIKLGLPICEDGWFPTVSAHLAAQGADGVWACNGGTIAAWDEEIADIYHAMLLATRDYVNRNRFNGVILGLSGGIDSALVAAIAADALGPERVWCVMLPSRFTSQSSLDDAAECARMIGCRHDTIPIAAAVDAFDTMLSGSFADKAVDITEENVQSRIRGVTLMALSNKFGPMLLTTGNKSEMSVGYATIYGDMAGGYNPLKDAYKMTVFALARWRNANKPRLGLGPDGPVMPESIITKPPSAELRPDQKDEDSLPPYADLDRMLHMLIEEEASVDDVVARYAFDRDAVVRIERLLSLAEYKRRQAPPGVKLGTRNFGRDRRYPITHGFRTG